MALLDSESHTFSTTFADYQTYNVYQTANGGGYYGAVGTAGPLGDNYLSFTGNATLQRTVTSASNSAYLGFRWNGNNCGLPWTCALLDPSGAKQFVFTVTSYGSGYVTSGNSGSVIGSVIPAGTFPSTGWFFVEIAAVLSATATGSITVKLNGTTVVYTASSIITQYAPSATVGLVQWTLPSMSSTTPQFMTHYYYCDGTGPAPWNTNLGDVRVQGRLPNGNYAVAFTANGLASNYLNAAKIPPLPYTDDNSSSTVGATDTYTLPAASFATVYGMQVKSLAYKSDSGARSMAAVMCTPSNGVLTGGATGAMTLAALQALTGTLVIAMDGHTYTAASMNFTGVASFAAAATVMQAALNLSLPTGGTACTVRYSGAGGSFIIKSGVSGSASAIAYPTSSGTIVTGCLLGSANGAVLAQGSNSGAVGVGANIPLALSGGLVSAVWQTDPNTSAQWTLAASNAATPGYRLTV